MSSQLVELPWRDYVLLEGPLSRAVNAVATDYRDPQTPNLWWPADHSWCVASEIDLPWTYVGGTSELISRLLDDERIEVLPAKPDDATWLDIKDWLSHLIEQTADTVLSDGSACLTLATGTVTVQIESPNRRGKGVISTRSVRSSSWSESNGPIDTRDPDELKRVVASQIHRAVLSLVDT